MSPRFIVSLVGALLPLVMAGAAETRPEEAFSTTQGARWQALTEAAAPSAEALDLRIDATGATLELDGFGGAFNELGWDAMQVLDEATRNRLVADLFGKDGLNFALGRLPIAASDYALSYYSYCDVKDDFTMRDFSIARDRYILIPYVKNALKVRPDLKLWASPWTPPAWMKINEHYTLQGGDLDGRKGGNEMDPRKNVRGNCTAFNMQTGYLQAYALYLAKYVQAYRQEGVNIWALMPQNEIAWSPNWPCCTWRPEDLAYFMGKYLIPRFEQDHIDTRIWLGTVNYPNPQYVRTILGDKAVAEKIAGVGFQWTGGKALPFIQSEFPAFRYMQTENMCGNGENNWKSLTDSWDMVSHYFAHGVSSYMYWNMVLDDGGKSSWGWPQNALITINRQTAKVTYTDEFYLMKHLSHHFEPGSRLARVTGSPDAIAYACPSGRTVVVLRNKKPQPATVRITVGEAVWTTTVAADSVNTVVFGKAGK